MRILAIRGKNLASLEGEFAVELQDGPLGDAGLFAITGRTGAGKSTLLDALCLALYDRVPRLPGERGGPAVGRAEPDAERLSVTDVRAILRKGQVEGHAEVDFIALDGRRYRAHWSVRRARGRPEGKLQAQDVSLTDLESGQGLSGTKTETLARIEALLGLNVEQFKRSVLLAQGDFAAFLKAPLQERSRLLERITGTEIYSVLSKAAHERARQVREEVERQRQRSADVVPLGPSARTELEGERERAEAERTTAAAAEEVARKAVAWHRRQLEIVAEQAAAEDDLQRTHAALEGLAERRAQLQEVEAAQALRAPVQAFDQAARGLEKARAEVDAAAREQTEVGTRKAEADARLAEASKALTDARISAQALAPALMAARRLDQRIELSSSQHSELEVACKTAQGDADAADAALRAVAGERARAGEELAAQQAWLDQHAGTGRMAATWESVAAGFDRLIRARTAVSEAQQRARACVADQKAKTEALDAAKGLERAAREALERAGQDLERASAAAQAAPAEALSGERKRLDARLQTLRDVVSAASTQASLADQCSARQVERSGWADAATAADKALAELLPQQISTAAALAEAERALTQVQLTLGKDVQALRATLIDGEPCPVCGGGDHPYAHEGAPAAALLDDAGARVGELRGQLEAIRSRQVGEETRRDAALERLAATASGFAQLQAQLESATQQWHERRVAIPGVADAARDALPALQVEIEGLSQERTDVHQREEAALALARAEAEARRAREVAADHLRETERAAAAAESASSALAHQLAAANESLDTHAQALAAATEELAQPLGAIEDWRKSLEADPHALRRGCEQSVAQWRAVQGQVDALTAALARQDEALVERTASRDGKRVMLEDRQAAVARSGAVLAGLQAERAALLDGEAVEAVERRLEEQARAAEQGVDLARTAQTETEKELAAATARSERARQQVGDGELEWKASGDRLEAALEEAGAELERVRELLARDAAWVEAERSHIAAVQRTHQAAEVRRDERERQRLRHEQERNEVPDLDAAQALLTQASAAVGEVQQRCAALLQQLADDDRRRERGAELARVLAELEREAHRWASLNEIIGSANGTKFATFAQSLTLDLLLAYANRHLAELTRRYLLERTPGEDLDIQVVDTDMGDEVRSVHSLSGGESFLAALALALGLASLSSNSVRVGSLFIDEGFGSLDPQTLDVAITALENLQASGRQVGVISHVQAMVERIGAQVRIIPSGNGRSRVEVWAGTSA